MDCRREEGNLDELYRQIPVQGHTGQHGGIPFGDGEGQSVGEVSGGAGYVGCRRQNGHQVRLVGRSEGAREVA